MKRVQADHPYSDYWLYKVWHKKEGRFQANLISISNPGKRTTISYARYLMSLRLGRLLDKYEHVDHIDNDKSNDSIENLQILTPEQNKKKQEEFYKFHNKTILQLNCSCCGKEFDYAARNHRYHVRLGRTEFCCSRSCGVRLQQKQLKKTKLDS